MTITVEIPEGLHAKLAAQAEAHGMDVPVYAAILLGDSVGYSLRERKPFNQEQFEKSLDEIAQFSHKIPVLPEEAFSRESIYQDHD